LRVNQEFCNFFIFIFLIDKEVTKFLVEVTLTTSFLYDIGSKQWQPIDCLSVQIICL